MENKIVFKKYIYFWLLLSLSIAFILYTHFLEVFPVNIGHWLAHPENIQVDQLLLDSGLCYCFLLALQLLLAGVLLDKYGIHSLTVLSLILFVLGAFFFAQSGTNSQVCLFFSRILMVVGISFVSVGYIKVSVSTIQSKKFDMVGGLLITTAFLGFIFGKFYHLDHWFHYTWQQTTIFTAAWALILATIFFLALRDDKQLPKLPSWLEIYSVIKNPPNWLLAGYSGLVLAPVLTFAGIIGKPYFQEAYQYPNHDIIILGAFLFIGLGIGCPVIGYLSGRLKRRRMLMLGGILLQEISFIPLIYLSKLPFWLNAFLLLVFGFASSAFILGFAIGREMNKLSVAGTLISLIKIAIVCITMITSILLGKFLIWGWDGKIVDGLRYFSIFDYHVAFTIFPVYLLLGFMLLLFVEEPSCWN